MNGMTVIVVAAMCSLSAPQVSDTATRLVQYDPALPLNATYRSAETTPDAEVFRLEYDSPKGGRVTGFLVSPRRRGTFAGIVFGHWGEGNATEFLPEAIRYAKAGAVSVLIDYPWVRVQPWHRKLFSDDTTADEDLTLLAQAIVDLRRAFDLLIGRPDVDRKRLAYVGHSFGAQFGAVLAAVDQRMVTAVLIAGHPSSQVTWFETDDPELIEVRKTVGDEALRHEFDVISVLDAIHFVPHAAPVSLLFQFARYEHIKEDRMKAYAQSASEPKAVRWYSSGHAVNDPAALADRAEWLQAQIGLKGARAAVGR